jgi:EAL domain-containing protein (putative c-di-GMP-specific phosphodiesterase class I)
MSSFVSTSSLESGASLETLASTVPCQRCETIPQKLEGPGTLLLRFPLSHSFSKILGALKHNAWEFARQGDTLMIEVDEQGLAPLAQVLEGSLTRTEQVDARALFHPSNSVAMLNSYFDVESLDRFLAKAQGNWLIDMLREERLTNHFQPLVDMQSGEVFAYECLMRGQENGQLVFPGKIIDTARASGILFQLDLAARRVAIRNSSIQGLQTKIFVNFTPTAIYDPVNCLSSTVALCKECGLKPEQMVFEIIETDHVDDTAHLVSILDYYRSRGFGVALDDLGAGYSSLELMKELQPDYVKLDRGLVSGVHQDTFKAQIAEQMLDAARQIGVKTVAEGIETLEELQWMREHGADYGQGFFLARPGFPPPVPQWPL